MQLSVKEVSESGSTYLPAQLIPRSHLPWQIIWSLTKFTQTEKLLRGFRNGLCQFFFGDGFMVFLFLFFFLNISVAYFCNWNVDMLFAKIFSSKCINLYCHNATSISMRNCLRVTRDELRKNLVLWVFLIFKLTWSNRMIWMCPTCILRPTKIIIIIKGAELKIEVCSVIKKKEEKERKKRKEQPQNFQSFHYQHK